MRKKRWGRFVNISSNSIGTNLPGLGHYMAAKMGVLGGCADWPTRWVRWDHGECDCAGADEHAGTSKVPEELKRSVWQLQAIKRFAEPEDIAGPIVFLTSDDAAFVTGQALVADGGCTRSPDGRVIPVGRTGEQHRSGGEDGCNGATF